MAIWGDTGFWGRDDAGRQAPTEAADMMRSYG